MNTEQLEQDAEYILRYYKGKYLSGHEPAIIRLAQAQMARKVERLETQAEIGNQKHRCLLSNGEHWVHIDAYIALKKAKLAAAAGKGEADRCAT